ncbi:MAG: tetratricopeptide repeat protein [bacterium]
MKKAVKTKDKPNLKAKGKAGTPEKRLNTWLPWGIAIILVVITWYLYKPSLNNQFTNWDDPAYVLENAKVKEAFPQNAAFFFTNASATNYHPLTMLSLSLDYNLAVKDKQLLRETDEPPAFIFHTTNLVFHLLNVLLVFVFFYLLSSKRLIIAAVTALLFAIHPMHVESVAWIAERKDVLYAFFFLAGLIAYLKYLEKPGILRLGVTWLLFSASLFSKPSAVVFPLILLTIDYFTGRKFTWKVLIEKIPFLILALAFGIITIVVQAHIAGAPLKAFTLFQRFMFASYGFIMYQYQLLLPLKIAAFYPFPSLDAFGNMPLIFYLSPFIALAIIALVWLSARFTKVIGFGYLFYFFSVVLVLQFMPVGSAIMADRYSYLSAIGLFFIIAWCLDSSFNLLNRKLYAWRWLFLLFFLLYSVFIGMIAYKQTRVWQNSETLWNDVISKYPQSEGSYKNRGNYYAKLNLTDKALDDFLIFVRMNQHDPGVYSNLGNIYGMRSEIEKALDAYSKSIVLDSIDPKTYLNRAITYAKAKQFLPAVKDYGKALTLSQGLIDVYMNRSFTFLEMGRYDDAIGDFSLLIRNFPANDTYVIYRGICYSRLKQYPKALADFEQGFSLNPANGQACFNISLIYSELKDYAKAYQYALKAQSIGFPVDKNTLETMKKRLSTTARPTL